MEIRNAKITGTQLGAESHGIFSAYLQLDYGGSGQSFGGYALDKHNGVLGTGSARVGTAYGMEFISRIMDAIGADSWEALKGMHCRVKQTDGKVHAIGHFLEDKWFCPDADMEAFKSVAP